MKESRDIGSKDWMMDISPQQSWHRYGDDRVSLVD